MVCEMLHKKGELTDDLRPREKFDLSEDYDDDDEDDGDLGEKGLPRMISDFWSVDFFSGVGTKKRRNYYRRKVPPELTGLGSSNKVRVYRVNLLLEEALSDDLNRKGRRMYYPERQPTKLGLVLGAGATLPDDCLRF